MIHSAVDSSSTWIPRTRWVKRSRTERSGEGVESDTALRVSWVYQRGEQERTEVVGAEDVDEDRAGGEEGVRVEREGGARGFGQRRGWRVVRGEIGVVGE